MPAALPPPPPKEPPKPIVLRPGQKEYKVVTQADQWFMGKFSPDRSGKRGLAARICCGC